MDYFKLLVFLCSFIWWHDVVGETTRPSGMMSKSSSISEYPETLFSLAVKYEHGEGVPQDKLKAIELYCEAAQLGYADALYALGWVYANGRGVSRNNHIAAQLFTMAAAQGHVHAQQMMDYISLSSESILPPCLETVSIEVEQKDEGVYSKGPIYKLVHKLAPYYEVDPHLVMAVISVESGFDVQAQSSKNAQGLMQLIPATAERFQVKNTFDAEDNIRGGMAYLRWLLAFFKGNVALVAAAYNAGEGAVEKYRGIPPYPETQDYVHKIKARYKKPTHPYQPNIVNRHSFVTLSAKDSD